MTKKMYALMWSCFMRMRIVCMTASTYVPVLCGCGGPPVVAMRLMLVRCVCFVSVGLRKVLFGLRMQFKPLHQINSDRKVPKKHIVEDNKCVSRWDLCPCGSHCALHMAARGLDGIV